MTDVAAGDTIDISHLGITAGNSVADDGPAAPGSATDTGREVSIEYLGTVTDHRRRLWLAGHRWRPAVAACGHRELVERDAHR
jgi:hypothetical protein